MPTKSGDLTTSRLHRYRPGMHSLQEIWYYQKRVSLFSSKMAFSHLIHEICHHDMNKLDIRFQAGAIAAIQEGMEAYLFGLLEDTQLEIIHGTHITIMPKDIHIAHCIQGKHS